MGSTAAMLGDMLRIACLILVGAMAPTAWAAPHGRVVRVERHRGTNATVPVLCEVRPDAQATCVGPPPSIGDTIVVVDEAHLVAEVRVIQLQPYMPKCDTLWKVTGEVVRGDLSQARSNKSIGLIDPTIDRRAARKISEDSITSPSSSPEVRVAIGVDRDGDGTADVIVTQYSCDASGQPANSNMAIDFCIDIWSRRDDGIKRAWTTKLQSCR